MSVRHLILKHNRLMYSRKSIWFLFLFATLILSLFRMLITDWSDPKHDIHGYSRVATEIENLLKDFSKDNLDILLKDQLVSRFLLPLLLAFLKITLNFDHLFSSILISFFSGIISLWLLKQISSFVIIEKRQKELDNNEYPLLVIFAFSTSPIFIRSLLTPATDMIALCFLLLSFWFFFKHIKNDKSFLFIVSVIIILLGAFVREVILISLLVYLLYPASKKKKFLHISVLGIPAVIFFFISLNFNLLFLNFIMNMMSLPHYHNNFVAWLFTTFEKLLAHMNEFLSFNVFFFISMAPLFEVFLFTSYRYAKRSPEDQIQKNFEIIGFSIFWALSYMIFFIFLWPYHYVQRYWLLNSFVLFQIALLPRFDLQNQANEPLSRKKQNSFHTHTNWFIFLILVGYNLFYEISSIIIVLFEI